ncbi:hypothetical protein KAH37_10530, partial [bacterium]|nr:hypothetical protein [bacterium]
MMRFFRVALIVFSLTLFASCGNKLVANNPQSDGDNSSVDKELSDDDASSVDDNVDDKEGVDADDDESIDGLLPDDDEIPDGDAWVCRVSSDCPVGFNCLNDGTTDDGCVEADQCQFDEDCGANEYCGVADNWNECFSLGAICTKDEECDFGSRCRLDIDPAFCEFVSECNIDDDCLPHFQCITVENWKECRETIENECLVHPDCEFGNRCNSMISPTKCESASECVTDFDCSDIQSCEREDNWKICKLNIDPQNCTKDEECDDGEVCETPIIGMGVCRSMNECDVDGECQTGERCESNGTYNECVKQAPCVTDEECGFGYRCLDESPENRCEYANECATSEDCPTLNSCQVEGNWTVCKFTTGSFCTSDADCKPDEYCDITVVAGACASRNQCYTDEDCGDGLKCESNGSYNECVPLSSEGCILDIQCQDGWACIENVCAPKYAGECTEIEGNWTVWISDIIIFPQGTTWEFIPNDGC